MKLTRDIHSLTTFKAWHRKVGAPNEEDEKSLWY
jgi:hypothetical protein